MKKKPNWFNSLKFKILAPAKSFIKAGTTPGNRLLPAVADGDHDEEEFQYEVKNTILFEHKSN